MYKTPVYTLGNGNI